MAADAAVDGIRERDPHGSIALVSAERFPPYKRPPLSKALWHDYRLERTFLKPSAAELGVDEHLGQAVTALDRAAHTVTLASGAQLRYERLLLATGASPKQLPFGEGVIYYRTMADYLRVRAAAKEGRRAVILGAGFIGCEMAAALRQSGLETAMVFPERHLLERLLPADLAAHVTAYYREKGVELHAEDVPVAVERAGDGFRVRTRAGRELAADLVLAGLGVRPNDGLAHEAGLRVEDGVVVDSRLQTEDPDVFAAGDVARFPLDALGGELVRIEHEDNAKSQGRLAGRNLAGAEEPYTHTPFFYSDLFNLGFEAVGVLDARLSTVADWKDGFRKGVVYYLDDAGHVRGVLLWNVWDAVPKAEAVIREGRPAGGVEALKGRI